MENSIPNLRAEGLINIVIIEDNIQLCEALVSSLNNVDGFNVMAGFTSCETAMKEKSVYKTDIVLLDISLPGMSGIEFIDVLLNENPQLLIIMITVHNDDDYIFTALSKGAIGFLLKSTTESELINCIRSAHKGGSPMTPAIARKVIKHFQKPKFSFSKLKEKLNDREVEILKYLVEGMSYNEIAVKVSLSPHTVNYHLRHIYEKLQVNTRGAAVAKALKEKL